MTIDINLNKKSVVIKKQHNLQVYSITQTRKTLVRSDQNSREVSLSSLSIKFSSRISISFWCQPHKTRNEI